jgi:hypothetical protein|tara:strand:- start:401 stop:574 length:174 start_codon:yes stop_codon:yes gene_type:complete
MISLPAKILALQEELKYAKQFALDNGPEDMGYVHTSIGWIEFRIKELQIECAKLFNK